jgi:hypothetical protein
MSTSFVWRVWRPVIFRMLEHCKFSMLHICLPWLRHTEKSAARNRERADMSRVSRETPQVVAVFFKKKRKWRKFFG